MKVTLNSADWHQQSGIYAKGFLFDKENNLWSGEELATYFSTVVSLSEFGQKLKDSNGLFTVIINRQEFKAFAIDGTRIYPLFYKQKNGELLLSDDPHLLLDKDSQISSTSLENYNASSATFAGETLVKDVLQIKGFHYAHVHTDGKVEQIPYYTYLVKKEEQQLGIPTTLLEMLNHVFERQIRSVGSRQIVVPLSGGADSRLILCMLKKFNFSNVVCYTVSRPGTEELRKAQWVANSLGYKFVAIDNRNADSSFVDDDEFKRYVKHMGCLTNFVWLYDFFAVRHLKNEGIIADNAVFMPGHSGDFLGGSLVCKLGLHEFDSAANMAKDISYMLFEYAFNPHVCKRIGLQLENLLKTGCLPYSAALQFITQNRLAMQANNAARVYEFFGYGVRLPFWDREILEYFRILPYSQLLHKKFYNDTINSVIFKPFEVEIALNEYLPDSVIRKQKIKNRIKRYIPNSILHHFSHFDDIVCEKEQVEILHKLMVDKKFRKKNYYTSNNEVIKDWYLMNVLELVGNQPVI